MRQDKCCCIRCHKDTTVNHLYRHEQLHDEEDAYAKSPRLCEHCGDPLKFSVARWAKENRGRFCSRECANEFQRKEMKTNFVAKAKEVHGLKYSYEKTEIKQTSVKVEITCHIHGSFYQLPHVHLMGHGCTKCYCDRRDEWLADDDNRESQMMNASKGMKFKEYKFNDGVEIKLQGYEGHAYDFLQSVQSMTSDDFILEGKRRFPYIASDGKRRTYYPDIILKNKNKIIEVKSTYTIKVDKEIENKRLAVLGSGYEYQLLLIVADKKKNRTAKFVSFIDDKLCIDDHAPATNF